MSVNLLHPKSSALYCHAIGHVPAELYLVITWQAPGWRIGSLRLSMFTGSKRDRVRKVGYWREV